jgi:AraC-like DNA-binding protein
MSLPAYRLIHPQANRSFILKAEPFDLHTRWHYHPEIELIYFEEGRTTAVIGQGFQQFDKGDLVLLGANFPHVLKEDPLFKQQSPGILPSGIIIQFTETFLGDDFFDKPEMYLVRQMLNKAKRGLKFSAESIDLVIDLLRSLHKLAEHRKLLVLLEVLVNLAEATQVEFLTPKDYFYDHTQDEERMHAINQFVYEHFQDDLPISTIAAVANMTETSFCRYFKSRTLKTFTRFLNEVRIAYASRLLSSAESSVTTVCFDSGFNNLSYFNRQFRNIMKMSPQQFRKWKLTAAA